MRFMFVFLLAPTSSSSLPDPVLRLFSSISFCLYTNGKWNKKEWETRGKKNTTFIYIELIHHRTYATVRLVNSCKISNKLPEIIRFICALASRLTKRRRRVRCGIGGRGKKRGDNETITSSTRTGRPSFTEEDRDLIARIVIRISNVPEFERFIIRDCVAT